MKKVALFSCLLTMICTSASAAGYLTYTPQSATLTVPAGGTVTQPMTVEIVNSNFSKFYIWLLDSVEGSIPSGWITADPDSILADLATPTTTVLTVSVPVGTPSGVYTGRVYSKAMATHEIQDRGTGMSLKVTVPATCAAPPAFEIVSFSPVTIWPPDHSMQSLTITGTVVLPAGCSISEIGYAIDDEYDVFTGMGTFTTAADGTFAVALPVEASREGADKNGRHYRITLYARDEAGVGQSAVIEAVVPHDMR